MKKFLGFLPSVWILLLLLQHPHVDVSVYTCELRRMSGDDILKKAFTLRFGFDVLKLRNFQRIDQKQSNGRCHGICLYPYVMLHSHRCACMAIWCIYTYRRGVCVARFDQSGNAKTSKRETSDGYRFSRFFYP